MNQSKKMLDTLESCYPDDAMAASIERDIQLTLPVIPALELCSSPAEREAVFQAEVSRAWLAFKAANGDPFGCDDVPASVKKFGYSPMCQAGVMAFV